MANVNFDVSNVRRCGCKACGCTEFVQESKLFEIPELMRWAANGDDILTVSPYPEPDMYQCKACGELHTLKEMIRLPSFRDMEKEKEEKIEDKVA